MMNIREQRWQILAGVAAGIVVAAVLFYSAMALFGDRHNGAADPMIDSTDPVAQDIGVAAASLVAAVNSYNPAEDSSPADAAARVHDQLSGKYLKLANDPQGAPLPAQWQAWAKSGDRIHAIAEPTKEFRVPSQETPSVEVPLTLRVFVWHADGDRTPLSSDEVRAMMVKEAGKWKLTDIEYVRSLP